MSGTIGCSFRLNLTVMKLIGLYPCEKYTNFHKIYATVLFVLLMPLPLILGTLHFVFAENLDPNNYDFVPVEMIFIAFKFLPFLRNRDARKKCIHFFDNYAIVNPEHRRIIEECISTCRRNSLIYFSGCIVSLTGVVGQTLMGGSLEKMPFTVWLPNVCREIRSMYVCIYFLLLFGIVYGVLACATVDPLIGGLSHHASAQLQILKHRLQFLHENRDGFVIYEQIRQCIRRYQDIVEFVDAYQKYFSPVVFSQFVGSVLVVGLCCFQLSVMKEVDVNFFVTISCLGILFFQLFFYCYYGTLLIEQNHTLSSAIYMSRWYEYDEDSKKALMILIERSKRPLVVTAGKVLDLSLETFTLILKRSYSFVAVLKNY